jgi:2-(1,2-epoxy-1,2-dihydrophenyl)acetyl-CoA isomerase
LTYPVKKYSLHSIFNENSEYFGAETVMKIYPSPVKGGDMSKWIEVKRNGNITEVILSRPETYNAFNLQMITEFADHLTQLASDDSVRGIAIAGKGKAFCAGGDLKWAVGYSEKAGSSFHTLASRLHLAIVEIRRMRKPVVAAINGTAAGAGFSLALACDFRIMEKSAGIYF